MTTEGDSEFDNVFDFEVLDNVDPIGEETTPERPIDEVWSNMANDPDLTKKWLNISTVLERDGFYFVHVNGIFERINPLKYKGSFDGCKIYFFEGEGAFHLLLDKSLKKRDALFKLNRLTMKLGPGSYCLEPRVYEVDDWEINQMIHESLWIPRTLNSELTFSVDITFRGVM